MYVSIAEVKAEMAVGDGSDVTDERITLAILKAEEFIEHVTGQSFEKERRTMYLDGNGRRLHHLPEFCIGIESITVSGIDIKADEYILYNSREDRNNPKIVFNFAVPKGRRSIAIDGYFGHVDIKPSGKAVTPLLIKKACIKLALSEVYALSDPERREFLDRERVVSENTDGHSYTLGGTTGQTKGFTGDPEIDEILLLYQRPLQIGAV